MWKEQSARTPAEFFAHANADFDVSIESVVQKRGTGESAEVVWVTHATTEGDIRKALNVVSQLPVVREISNWIRVEE